MADETITPDKDNKDTDPKLPAVKPAEALPADVLPPSAPPAVSTQQPTKKNGNGAAKKQDNPFAELVKLPIVHYVLLDGERRGECRQLHITRIVSLEDGILNGRVPTDDVNDYQGPGQDGLYVQSVHYSAEKEPDTWHWGHEH